jgi:hypothetical protein
LDQAGPLSFEGLAGGLHPLPRSSRDPGYGRDPVGNGHAAAGFSAVLAPVVAAVDGAATRLIAIVAAGLALGLAALLAFFFFLADFFLPAAFFLTAFFDDLFFFFFFFPPFFAFFFAILNLLQGC